MTLPSFVIRLPRLHAIVHVAHRFEIAVRGKLVAFELGSYGGPLLIGKRGDPLKNQPDGLHPFWPAFEAWEKQGHRLDGDRCIFDALAARDAAKP